MTVSRLFLAICTALVATTLLHGFDPPGKSDSEAGFVPIFNGKDTTGWHLWRPENAKGRWLVQDGSLVPEGRPRELASDAVYGNFDLRFEWKIATGGNSGVMYRTAKGYHAPTSGPEYQLIDDEHHRERLVPEKSTGAAYAIYAPSDHPLKPAGEWNTARIVARGNHIEHWLNGKLVLDYKLHTKDWKERVAAGKFATHPQYGTGKRGHIILQDHGAAVWFRNIRIKKLGQ
jgi:3-keto-disaccharide hydrolase